MNKRAAHRAVRHSARPRRRKIERGATLIEVLVAVVVLSIGLLGLAGLQVTSLQSNHSAYMRSQASLLAYDLADRMRAARSATEGGAYDDETEGDRADWDASVTALLGDGATGSIVRNGLQVTVTIRWNDTRGCVKGADKECTAGDAGESQTFIYWTEI